MPSVITLMGDCHPAIVVFPSAIANDQQKSEGYYGYQVEAAVIKKQNDIIVFKKKNG